MIPVYWAATPRTPLAEEPELDDVLGAERPLLREDEEDSRVDVVPEEALEAEPPLLSPISREVNGPTIPSGTRPLSDW